VPDERKNEGAQHQVNYAEFLEHKSQLGSFDGFEPLWMPDYLFDFQKSLVAWAIHKGRAAIFADCGLGKTIQELVWAQNIVQKTNKPVLIVCPLAVSYQTIREGDKFGIECARSNDGVASGDITVTNYEQLHKFDPDDFAGVVCDESSVLKNFDGVRKKVITEFLRTRKYRLLATATAAPNDYIELGTTSEALGELGHMDMLGRFFKNDQNTIDPRGRWGHGGLTKNGAHMRIWEGKGWRFKHHAEQPFWRWVCSWARALRKPSDLGFSDDDFILPPLVENQIVIEHSRQLPGELFPKIAVGLHEQRAERRETIKERCEKVAEIVVHKQPAIAWCHLNTEGDLLEKIIPDAVQVSGADSDSQKEEAFLGFINGQVRVLVIKPKIGAFGLNFQHCAHVTFFPSHSWEQYYQGVRRCWRFGQKRPVVVDIVTTLGELDVLKNLQRKAAAADRMFEALVNHMNEMLRINRTNELNNEERIPEWL
jgi:hypothetical protein